jgi:uncharacterized protein YuzE
MEIKYDKEVDAMYITFEKGEYEVSEEIGDGIVFDVSKKGKLIGIEVLDASEKLSHPVLKRILSKEHQ